MADAVRDVKPKDAGDTKPTDEQPDEMSLLEFIKMYKVGEIPIFHFIIFYILFYIINCIFLNYDFKIVLISAIPATLLYELAVNPQRKLTLVMLIILALTIYYVLTCVNQD